MKNALLKTARFVLGFCAGVFLAPLTPLIVATVFTREHDED